MNQKEQHLLSNIASFYYIISLSALIASLIFFVWIDWRLGLAILLLWLHHTTLKRAMLLDP